MTTVESSTSTSLPQAPLSIASIPRPESAAKVTCLAIGDPHFQVTNVRECELLIQRVELLIRTMKPTFVVVLGDTLHTHEKIHVSPLNVVYKFFTMLSELVQTFVLIGNHDMINHSQFLTDQHCFNAFKRWPNLTIVDQVHVARIGGRKFVFCPYVPPGRFVEALDTVKQRSYRLEDPVMLTSMPSFIRSQLQLSSSDPTTSTLPVYEQESWQDADCVFCHQEFYGCRFNPIQTSTEGDVWPETNPFVIAGHIHDEQKLQSNVYYTGSSMQHGFAETTNKVVVLATFTGQSTMANALYDKYAPLVMSQSQTSMDSETRSTAIATAAVTNTNPTTLNPSVSIALKRVDLQLLKKRTFYVNVSDADTFKPPSDTMVRLVVRGRPEQIRVFRRGDAYKTLTRLGVKVTFAPSDDSIEPSASATTAIARSTKSIRQQTASMILDGLIKDSSPEVQSAYESLLVQIGAS